VAKAPKLAETEPRQTSPVVRLTLTRFDRIDHQPVTNATFSPSQLDDLDRHLTAMKVRMKRPQTKWPQKNARNAEAETSPFVFLAFSCGNLPHLRRSIQHRKS